MAAMMDYPAWMQYYNMSGPCGYYPAQDYTSQTCMVSPQAAWPHMHPAGQPAGMYSSTPPHQQISMMGFYNPSLSPTHRGTPRPAAVYHGVSSNWPNRPYINRDSCSPVMEMSYEGYTHSPVGQIVFPVHPCQVNGGTGYAGRMTMGYPHDYTAGVREVQNYVPINNVTPQWNNPEHFKKPIPIKPVPKPPNAERRSVYYSVHQLSVQQDVAYLKAPYPPSVITKKLWPSVGTDHPCMSMQTGSQHAYTTPRSEPAVVPSNSQEQHSTYHEVQQYKQKSTGLPHIGFVVEASSVPMITLDTGTPQTGDDLCRTPSKDESNTPGIQLWKQGNSGSKSGGDSCNGSPVNDFRRGMISPEGLSDESAISPRSVTSMGSSYDADEELISSAAEDSSAQDMESMDQMQADSRRHNQYRRPNKPLNALAVYLLNDWYHRHMTHPYPTNPEKKLLADMGGVSVSQVTAWFANKRNRTGNTKPKQEKRKLSQKVAHFCEELAKAAGTGSNIDDVVSKTQIDSLLQLDTMGQNTKNSDKNA